MTQAIKENELTTVTFEWGIVKWLVNPKDNGAGLTMGLLVLFPGKGHSRHSHEDSEEILYILDGTGEQTIEDGEAFTIRAGDTLYLPRGSFHSTYNTGWEPMRVLAIYNPGGAEEAFREMPDFIELAAGELPQLIRGSI